MTDSPGDRQVAGSVTAGIVNGRAAIGVLVVEDHPMYREGLRGVIDAAEDLLLRGEMGDAEGLLEADLAGVDVVLMDLHLPGMSGIEATRRLLERDAAVRVLCLSMLDDDDSVFSAMRAGARGYLLKGADRNEVVEAIRAVARGDVIFGAGLARRVLGFFARPTSQSATSAFPELTERELQILERLARGDDNPVIAHRFGLSPKTVQNHVSNILSKLRVADRAQAIVRARDAGLGSR